MPVPSSITRRRLLTAAALAPLATVPAADPVLAAIARHRELWLAMDDRQHAAFLDMFAVEPTTRTGIAALAAHVREMLEMWGSDDDCVDVRGLKAIEAAVMRVG